jgi:hypothetical protein
MAFYSCKRLKQLDFSNGLREIKGHAFEQCTQLKDIVLPSNLTIIGTGVIDHTAIEYINIPSSVEYIHLAAVYNCTTLKGISVEEDNPYYSSYEGALYNKDHTKLLIVPMSLEKKQFVIPEGVLSISQLAFIGCNGIKDLCINDDVEVFPYYIFSFSLFHLESITLGSNNKLFKLVDGVLFSADGKTLIRMPYNSQPSAYVIPATTEIIHDGAFRGCDKLEKLVIHSQVKSIGKNVFIGCSGLRSLYSYVSPIYLKRDVFEGITRNKCNLYVPEYALGFMFYREAYNGFIINTFADEKRE